MRPGMSSLQPLWRFIDLPHSFKRPVPCSETCCRCCCFSRARQCWPCPSLASSQAAAIRTPKPCGLWPPAALENAGLAPVSLSQRPVVTRIKLLSPTWTQAPTDLTCIRHLHPGPSQLSRLHHLFPGAAPPAARFRCRPLACCPQAPPQPICCHVRGSPLPRGQEHSHRELSVAGTLLGPEDTEQTTAPLAELRCRWGRSKRLLRQQP